MVAKWYFIKKFKIFNQIFKKNSTYLKQNKINVFHFFFFYCYKTSNLEL